MWINYSLSLKEPKRMKLKMKLYVHKCFINKIEEQ